MSILDKEELIALLFITGIGIWLSFLGKLTANEVNLLTWSYGAFAGSKGLANLIPEKKQ